MPSTVFRQVPSTRVVSPIPRLDGHAKWTDGMPVTRLHRGVTRRLGICKQIQILLLGDGAPLHSRLRQVELYI